MIFSTFSKERCVFSRLIMLRLLNVENSDYNYINNNIDDGYKSNNSSLSYLWLNF